MGKVTGFKESGRLTIPSAPATERIHHFGEIYGKWSETQAREQGSRCMNCSVPFCHMGCPLGNLIPDWNDHVYRGPLEGSARRASPDQRLPGVHRPHLPRAVRGLVRPLNQPGPGDDRAHRKVDR